MTVALQLDTLILERGSHDPPNGDPAFCVMEAVAYVAGEPWTDHPECASPVIAAFLRRWNDDLPDEDRQMLEPLIPRLVGTRTTADDEETRAWMATDWLVRECAPAWLRLAGLTKEAELLEELVPVTSAERARAAQPQLDAAKESAAAAWDAAGAAAWDAAGAAAWDAAGAAAWDAAWDAARDAAGAAAWDAIQEKFAPTVKGLQTSALLLVERMIDVGRETGRAA